MTYSSLLRPLHSGAAQMLQMTRLTETAEQALDAQDLERRFSIRMMRLEDWVRMYAR